MMVIFVFTIKRMDFEERLLIGRMDLGLGIQN